MEPPFNLDEALRRVDGDRELLAELAGIFVADAPAMLADVASAVTTGDAVAVSSAAHRLKGSIVTFGANAAAAVATTLEKGGRAGDLTTARADVERLGAEIDRLREGLESLVRDQPRGVRKSAVRYAACLTFLDVFFENSRTARSAAV